MNGNKHRALVLQERDRHLLRELAVMRVFDREQAKTVAGFRSTTRVNSRLLRLTQAGLLRRSFLGTVAGGRKAIYALSLAGAKLLGVSYRSPRRGHDEVLVADFFVAHQLSINELYCLLKYRQISVADAKFLRWMNFSEPLDSGSPLIPDGYVEIASPKGIFVAFLEVDLGHEGRMVWKKKIEGYLRYAISGNFTNRFGKAQFRVLVVTKSERSLRLIRSVASSLTDKVFRFATFESIYRDGFWSSVWLRPRGDERQSLL
jgi:hypothetical protein